MIAFDNNAIADVLEFMLGFYYCSVSVFGSETYRHSLYGACPSSELQPEVSAKVMGAAGT